MKQTILLLIFLINGYHLLAQETILYPSDLDAAVNFGREVIANDNYIMLHGQGGEDRVYIFRTDGINWVEEAILTADSIVDDCFGCDLAAYGDYLLIGAPGDDENGDSSGAAYIYKKEGSNWVEEVKLMPADASVDQQCGTVALYEDYAIVGCATTDINTQVNSGSAYIYKKEGNNWVEEAKITPSDPTAFGLFGLHVSLNEDYAFIGAPHVYDDNNIKTGAVYIFKKIGDEWIEQTKITPDDGMASDGFTKVIAMGDTLFVGATKSPGNNEYYKGAGYVYVRDGEDWIEVQKLIPEDSEEENKSLKGLGFSGDYAALATSNIVKNAPVHLFKDNEGIWEQINLLSGLGLNNERYGHDIFLTNDYLVVGAFHTYYYQGDDSIRTGSVYVYDLDMLVSEQEAKAADSSIRLFPSPSRETITVSLTTSTPVLFSQLELYDINGQLLKQYAGNGLVEKQHDWTIDVSNLSTGTYIIRSFSNEYVFSERFVKM